jgi:hypothetical protein
MSKQKELEKLQSDFNTNKLLTTAEVLLNFTQHMRAKSQLDRSKEELRGLGVGISLGHPIKITKRQSLYDAAARLGYKLSIRELPTKIGQFIVTRIA